MIRWHIATTILLTALAGAVGPAAASGPVYWDWRGGDLADVRLHGAALDTTGAVVRGLSAAPLGPTGPEVFWCLEPDGAGGFYTGSGHAGEIHHTDRDGEVTLVATVPGTEVFSLHLPADGAGLLAGCGPEGQIFRIGEDGTPLELGRVPGGYVWELRPDPARGVVWLATGSPAAVWRLDADGTLEEFAALDAQNVLDVALDAHGRLLAATQGPGLVYRLDPDGDRAPELLFEAPQNEIRQFVRGPGGALHALALHVEPEAASDAQQQAASMLQVLNGHDEPQVPRSALYRLEEDGLVVPVWSGDEDVMIAAWSPRWGWLAGTVQQEDTEATRLLGLVPPAGTRPVAGWSGGDVLALLVDGDRLIAAEAHPGAVTALSADGAGHHRALGPPVDAGRPVRWGRLRWDGSGDLGGVRWSCRGGNRARPDASWSDWQDLGGDRDLRVDLAPSRYLQWRVELPERGDARVTAVSLSARRANLPPSIAEFREERVRELQEGGLLPRGENVTQTMDSGLRVEFGRASRQDGRPDPRRADRVRPVRIFSWKGSDPDGDRLLWDLEYRREDDAAWRPILAGSAESVGSWDTSDLPDGAYRVRLTASDAADNPADEAGRDRRELGPLRVDNTPPRLTDLRLERADAGLRVRLRAEDAAGVLGWAHVVLPDGRRERLDPVDGICDSRREEFDRTIPWPPADRAVDAAPWHLRVEVRDLTGNVAVAEGEVR